MPGGSPIHIIASSSWINFQDKVRIVSTKWGKGGIREFTLCHSTFPVCCDKVTWQKQPKTKAGDVFWLTVLVQSIMVGSQDWRSLRELITLGTGQETVINMFSKFSPFPYLPLSSFKSKNYRSSDASLHFQLTWTNQKANCTFFARFQINNICYLSHGWFNFLTRASNL